MTASDEDECQSGDKNKCSQPDNCVNSDGGYNCTCDIGYVLDSDKRTCNRESTETIKIIFLFLVRD